MDNMDGRIFIATRIWACDRPVARSAAECISGRASGCMIHCALHSGVEINRSVESRLLFLLDVSLTVSGAMRSNASFPDGHTAKPLAAYSALA